MRTTMHVHKDDFISDPILISAETVMYFAHAKLKSNLNSYKKNYKDDSKFNICIIPTTIVR